MHQREGNTVCSTQQVNAQRSHTKGLFTTKEEVLLLLLFPKNWTTPRMPKLFFPIKHCVHVYAHHDWIILIIFHVNSWFRFSDHRRFTSDWKNVRM